MFGNKYCGSRTWRIERQTPHTALNPSRLLSTLELAALPRRRPLPSASWIGLALPGLPLLPGVGGGTTSNVSISLSSAVLGVQDSRTFAQSNGVAGPQARLLSLLLPAPDPLGTKLATKLVDTEARSAASMAVALPTGLPAPTATNNGPRVNESTPTRLCFTSCSCPARAARAAGPSASCFVPAASAEARSGAPDPRTAHASDRSASAGRHRRPVRTATGAGPHRGHPVERRKLCRANAHAWRGHRAGRRQ